MAKLFKKGDDEKETTSGDISTPGIPTEEVVTPKNTAEGDEPSVPPGDVTPDAFVAHQEGDTPADAMGDPEDVGASPSSNLHDPTVPGGRPGDRKIEDEDDVRDERNSAINKTIADAADDGEVPVELLPEQTEWDNAPVDEAMIVIHPGDWARISSKATKVPAHARGRDVAVLEAPVKRAGADTISPKNYEYQEPGTVFEVRLADTGEEFECTRAAFAAFGPERASLNESVHVQRLRDEDELAPSSPPGGVPQELEEATK